MSLCFLPSKDPLFSTGSSQPADLNSKNHEELKMKQYGKKTPKHHADSTLGPLAHHFETQKRKASAIFLFDCGFVFLLICLLLKNTIFQDEQNTEKL